MSKLAMMGAAALSLALTVATPALAVEVNGGGNWMPFGGGSRAEGSGGSVVRSDAVAHCLQRWAYYDQTSGRYMGDDGQWRPCQ
jgi:hypothetical protein